MCGETRVLTNINGASDEAGTSCLIAAAQSDTQKNRKRTQPFILVHFSN